ncbi:helix-turn-helix domain-containing protein [Streptomyces sp. NPDC054783]
MSDVAHAREVLGDTLRQLRRDSGLTGRQLAAKCGWLPSKVANIESGRQTPTSRDINVWTTAAGVPNAAPALKKRLNAIEAFYRDWHRQTSSGVSFTQSRWVEREARSTSLRVFEPHFVPGLLQTPDYARGRLSDHARLHDAPDDVEQAVATRLQRQELLREENKRFHFVITELALLSGAYATENVMAAQIEHLLSFFSRTNIALGVLPIRTSWGVNVDHGFWIFDDAYVLAETVTAEIRLTQPEELSTYRRVFQSLAGRAQYDEAAQDILDSALANLNDHN